MEERGALERRCEALERERDALVSSLRSEREAAKASEEAAASAAAAAAVRCAGLEEKVASAQRETEAVSTRLSTAVAVRRRMGIHLAPSIPQSSSSSSSLSTTTGEGVGSAEDILSTHTSSPLWEATDVLGACALGSLWIKHREAIVTTVRGLHSSLHAIQEHILSGGEEGMGGIGGGGVGETITTGTATFGVSSQHHHPHTSPPPSYHGAHETLRLSLFREVSSLRTALAAAVESRESQSQELERLRDTASGVSAIGGAVDRVEVAAGALRELLTTLSPALEGCKEIKEACAVEREEWVRATQAAVEWRRKELEGEFHRAFSPIPPESTSLHSHPPHTHPHFKRSERCCGRGPQCNPGGSHIECSCSRGSHGGVTRRVGCQPEKVRSGGCGSESHSGEV